MCSVILQMNDTRRDWTNFDCNKVKEKNYNVLSLSGIFGFLTFIYYAAVRKHEKYKSKIQTRTYRLLLLIEARLGCMAYRLIANGRENVYFFVIAGGHGNLSGGYRQFNMLL